MSDQKNLGQQVGQYTIQRDDNSWKVVRTTQDFTKTGRDKGDNTVSPHVATMRRDTYPGDQFLAIERFIVVPQSPR